jgi:hypothetical protein
MSVIAAMQLTPTFLRQILVLSFFIGLIFFRVHPNGNQLNFNLLRSVFFTSLLNMTLFNLGQLPRLVEERKLFYKQTGANFYRPSSYVFANLVGSAPFSMAEVILAGKGTSV